MGRGHRVAQFRLIALVGGLTVVLAAGWAVAGLWPGAGAGPGAMVRAGQAGQAGQAEQARQVRKGTGLPLPRFVSLKNSRTNVRRGPARSYPIAWEFNRRGLPVEITREFENWRRIRDSEGSEGWIFQAMLSGHRSVLVAPWDRDSGALKALRKTPEPGGDVVARLEPQVLASISRCTGAWCSITAGAVKGWIVQEELWGVYPKEIID